MPTLTRPLVFNITMYHSDLSESIGVPLDDAQSSEQMDIAWGFRLPLPPSYEYKRDTFTHRVHPGVLRVHQSAMLMSDFKKQSHYRARQDILLLHASRVRPESLQKGCTRIKFTSDQHCDSAIEDGEDWMGYSLSLTVPLLINEGNVYIFGS